MGIIAGAKAEARVARRVTGGSLQSPPGWLLNLFGMSKTAAGVVVNETTALTLSAFWCAVEAISGDIAKLPLGVYSRSGGTRVEIPNDPAAVLLNRAPCPEMIPIAFRQTMQAHALTQGNGVAEIEWANNGRPLALWVIPPPDYRILRDDQGRIVYDVKSPITGRTTGLYAQDVFHIYGLGFDGTQGYSVVRQARESLGLTMAAERFGAAFFGNGAVPSGVLSHPRTLSDPARDRLKRDFKEKQGGDQTRGLAVLEEGVEYKPIGIPPEDGQFLQSRQFQIPEIARWFRMPPHKLMDLLRGTFSNIEHQSIEYVTDCLGAWLIRWEQEIARKFFGATDGRYARHNVAALLRGDLKARYDAYAVGRQWGFLTVNQILALEDENGIGTAGDVHLAPSNMVPADKLVDLADAQIKAANKPAPVGGSQPSPPPASPKNGNQNRDLVRNAIVAVRPVLNDALARVRRTEEDKIKRAAAKPAFDKWLESFLPEHRDHVRGAAFPMAESIALSAAMHGAMADAGKIAAAVADRHMAQLRSALAGDPAGAAARVAAIKAEDDDWHLSFIADNLIEGISP